MEGMDTSDGDFSVSAYRFILFHTNLTYFNQHKHFQLVKVIPLLGSQYQNGKMTAEEYTEVC
jgi:hypothetical protein